MTDFQLASQKIVSDEAIQAYDEVTDPAVIEGVRPLAESQLTAMLLRAGCDMDTLAAADAATVWLYERHPRGALSGSFGRFVAA